jgi:hypothetical protein
MSHKHLLIVPLMSLLAAFSSYAQVDSIPVRDEKVSMPAPAAEEQIERPLPVKEIPHRVDIGFGIGLDYGGILGAQAGFAPVKHLTLFAAAGYDIIGFGWQVGAKGLILPKTDKKVARPFGKVMYGANSVIIVDGADYYNEIYLGFTVGAGLELRFGKRKSNGLDIDLNFPIRTQKFWDDWDVVKNDPNLEVLQDPLPVAFSVGYHFEF